MCHFSFSLPGSNSRSCFINGNKSQRRRKALRFNRRDRTNAFCTIKLINPYDWICPSKTRIFNIDTSQMSYENQHLRTPFIHQKSIKNILQCSLFLTLARNRRRNAEDSYQEWVAKASQHGRDVNLDRQQIKFKRFSLLSVAKEGAWDGLCERFSISRESACYTRKHSSFVSLFSSVGK